VAFCRRLAPAEREQELATLKEYVALLLTKIIDQCPAILEELSRSHP